MPLVIGDDTREAKIAECLVILDPEAPSFERQVGCCKDQ